MRGSRLWFRGLLAVVLPAAVGIYSAFGQQVEVGKLGPLQEGITLPVSLHEALRAGKSAPGAQVLATTTQRVPIDVHTYLRRGAEVVGEVTESTAGGNGVLGIRFTSLRYHGQTVPLRVSAIAIANFVEVGDTEAPAGAASDRGYSNPASWVTEQVGGDEVYRSGWVGPVCNVVTKEVGFADFHGVYSLPGAVPDAPDFPVALGVFSTTASGVYGFGEGVSLHSEDGVIRITGPAKRVLVRRGDNLLLRVAGQR
jgi:hypothetical protein